MEIDTVIYESKNPTAKGREFLSFIVIDVDEMDGKKKTGNKVKNQLPVAFYGHSAIEVVEKARKFWAEETAKARAKSEHGKALGESRRKKSA